MTLIMSRNMNSRHKKLLAHLIVKTFSWEARNARMYKNVIQEKMLYYIDGIEACKLDCWNKIGISP